MSKPSTNGTSGRKSNGQFAEGNKGGIENWVEKKVSKDVLQYIDANFIKTGSKFV